MLKQPFRLYSSSLANNFKVICRKDGYSTAASSTKLKYDLFSAVCLERHPIITKPLNDLEKQYMDHLQEMEVRNSLKNEFEIRKELEIKEAELIKAGVIQVDLDKPQEQNTIDIEETASKELQEFVFAPRITEADEKRIVTSLDRKLDRNLLLLIEQKYEEKTYWIPPQSLRAEGETLRDVTILYDTAERVLKEACGDKLSVKFYGNAPIGVYKYSYPNKLKEKLGSHGAKVFYFLAKYINGNVPEQVKYQWLDRTEMKEVLPKGTYKNISYFLIPEK